MINFKYYLKIFRNSFNKSINNRNNSFKFKITKNNYLKLLMNKMNNKLYLKILQIGYNKYYLNKKSR